jgi:NitT/TauT family transport system permease protein
MTPGTKAPAHPARWALVGLIALVVVWECWVRIGDVRPAVTIEPSRIARELAAHPRFWLHNTWRTAWHTLVGVGVSVAAAVVVGAALAAYRRLEFAVQPILVLVMVTPWVAYITSIRSWLRSGTPTILFMVAFVTFPPLVFAVVHGMRSADVAARELLASVDASRSEVLWRLRLPSALPSLFNGLRVGAGLGLAAAYFSEGGAVAARVGLGEVGRRASQNTATGYPILWGAIVCAAVLGVTFLAVVVGVERRVLSWHSSQRGS